MGHFLGDIRRETSFISLHRSSPPSASNSKMKTFVLAAFIASAAFGLASAYECSQSMQSMVDSEVACAGECEWGLDACIVCVMQTMGFEDDAGEIVKIERQILDDGGEEGHSKKCINSVGEDFGINTDKDLEDLLAQLTGKTLKDVMDSDITKSTTKQQIYRLFGAAKACIANAKPTQQYKCGNE